MLASLGMTVWEANARFARGDEGVRPYTTAENACSG